MPQLAGHYDPRRVARIQVRAELPFRVALRAASVTQGMPV